MVIKKRPIITWLLNTDLAAKPNNIVPSSISNPILFQILNVHFSLLNEYRIQKPNWGLPELLTKSFENVMRKSAPAFEKVMPEYFHEFSKNDECGILLSDKDTTFVYRFNNDTLNIWYFTENHSQSIFNFYTICNFDGDRLRVGVSNSIISDNDLFHGSIENREDAVGSIANLITVYVAVKRKHEIETVVIPEGKFTQVEGTPLEYVENKKVINQTGQKIIVMDSKWFRKIINDNDIPVSGFYRMQNKKNAAGEWYKEKIKIDPFIRHGYHRNAKMEDDSL